MKVIYKSTKQIIDDIIDAANQDGREILKIELSSKEWLTFCGEVEDSLENNLPPRYRGVFLSGPS